MTTQTLSQTKAGTSVLPIIGAAALGLFLIFVAGVSQAAALHDAAHDTRHALVFPCH